jgi:hypothetical protein
MLGKVFKALGLVTSTPPATEETGAMGREIESRQGIGWYVPLEKNYSGHPKSLPTIS